MNGLIVVNWIAFVILLIGGLNWGLVGIFNFNLVSFVAGGYNAFSIIIYVLVFLSAIWLCFSSMLGRGILLFERQR